MKRRPLLSALGAGIAGLAGCSGESPSIDETPSPTDATTGPATHTPAPTPETADVAAEWDTFLPGLYTLAAPAVADGRLFIGTEDSLFALDTEGGSEIWTGSLGALTHAFTPALTPDGVVAVGRDAVGGSVVSDAPGVLAAFSREGEERWRVEGPITAGPVVHDGSAHVVTRTEERVTLRAHALADGSEESAVDVGEAGDRGTVTPVVLGDRLVATVNGVRPDGSTYSRLVAVRDGDPDWTVETESAVAAAPVVHGGRLYVGTEGGRVHAVAADGSAAWTTDVGGELFVTPAVAPNGLRVVAGTDVIALSFEGVEGWRTEVGDVRRTGLTVADGRTYVGGEALVAFGSGGEEQWRFELGGIAGAFGTPVVREGQVFTGACIKREGNDPYDHHVYALDADA
ncbi:PQQ-binding-like beta-propeller repeat protein [Halorarum halobium]|uniref:outer membrane protein assembly factor BamB family protein n=1 Tax=Halorarum halobium TaxID=3075121 RepID=UPI0028B1B9CD|nr:PQQ-binding-like beta-propeller repeat protein [Halobaculum sp. XH14]